MAPLNAIEDAPAAVSGDVRPVIDLYRAYVLAVLWVVLLLRFVDLQIVSVLLKSIRREFAVSDMNGVLHTLRRSRLLLSSVLVLCGVAHGVPLAGPGLVAALGSGGYVILMRHASSPPTPPEPAQANPDNTQHERQLDESGRASARAMGEALRQLHIPVGEVLSSPTYRALETVRLARLGMPKKFPELGDAGHSMTSDKTGKRGAWLRERVAVQPPRGTNTIIVTHFPNVSEAFPDDAKGLEDGEALIFRPDSHGGASLIARVKITEWARLASSP